MEQEERSIDFFRFYCPKNSADLTYNAMLKLT